MDARDNSTLGRMQQKYWTTKHSLLYKKTGLKQEDECIIASDHQLDTKLELYHAIEQSCDDLLRVIENYQDRICILAHEENALGRFLKENGKIDKTRAGKMMSAVGKTMSYTAQQRLSLRVPLVRLYQEVETFRNRAVVDSSITVNKMEASRTNYRGALLWMKDVSQELDPDTYKRLEKFRKVQSQVKVTKFKFDKLKLDTCQKIDLLSASRCNMFSRILATYQTTLVQFWEKTARTFTHVSECFRGYQHYEFAMLKELSEPSKRLAEETSKSTADDVLSSPGEDKDKSLFFDGEYHDDETGPKKDDVENVARSASLINLTDASFGSPDTENNLIDVSLDDSKLNGTVEEKEILKPAKALPDNLCRDLLTNNPEIADVDKDDLTLLNEILDAPNATGTGLESGTFSQQWLSSFGTNSATTTATSSENNTSAEADLGDLNYLENFDGKSEFLPSHLLDLQADRMKMQNDKLQGPSSNKVPTSVEENENTKKSDVQSNNLNSKKKATKDMSAWFDLFADLDPLANPDAVGKNSTDMANELRNC